MYRYPFTPYPNGWFRVAYSEDLGPRQVQPLKYLGRDLVLFRGEDGQARVLDAHCPHLGAHMGMGGQVKGNQIACPFHDWAFNGDGECTDIPYCKKIPRKARVNAWHVSEKNGLIFIHHHADGKAPTFDIPDVPAASSKKWGGFVKFDWTIRVHIQEVAENALDLPHFEKVHAYLNIPSLSQFDIKDHTFQISLAASRKVMGFIGKSEMEITYHGLGVVHARVKTKPINLQVILTTTPVDDEHVEIHIAVLYEKSLNPIRNFVVEKYLAKEIAKDFAHDIPLWENKVYLQRPVLCRDDGPIMQIRRWAKQFYSEYTAGTQQESSLVQLPTAAQPSPTLQLASSWN